MHPLRKLTDLELKSLYNSSFLLFLIETGDIQLGEVYTVKEEFEYLTALDRSYSKQRHHLCCVEIVRRGMSSQRTVKLGYWCKAGGKICSGFPLK